jgi:transposase-like protein
MDIHKKQLKEVIAENLPNIDKCTDEILRLFIVVRRSELLNCPYCGSSNIQQKTKSNDECEDCCKEWAV